SNRSDIYSLGCVLYEMLSGNPPHVGASAQQIIMRIVTEDAAPVTTVRKSVPPNVAGAGAKAIGRLPADRFETAAEFSRALADPQFRWDAGTSGSGPESGLGGRSGGWRGWGAVAALVAVAVLVGRWTARSGGAEQPTARFAIPV